MRKVGACVQLKYQWYILLTLGENVEIMLQALGARPKFMHLRNKNYPKRACLKKEDLHSDSYINLFIHIVGVE